MKNDLSKLLKEQLEPLKDGVSTLLTDLFTSMFAQQKQMVSPQSSLDMGIILPIVLIAGGGICLLKK